MSVDQVKQNLGHIVIAVVVIAAVVVLALAHTITGGEALGVIGVAGGASLGGGVASSSAGTVTPVAVTPAVVPAISPSGGTGTTGPTPTAPVG